MTPLVAQVAMAMQRLPWKHSRACKMGGQPMSYTGAGIVDVCVCGGEPDLPAMAEVAAQVCLEAHAASLEAWATHCWTQPVSAPDLARVRDMGWNQAMRFVAANTASALSFLPVAPEAPPHA